MKEKDTRASMLFGRAFEKALSSYFRRDDPRAVLFRDPRRSSRPGIEHRRWEMAICKLLFCRPGLSHTGTTFHSAKMREHRNLLPSVKTVVVHGEERALPPQGNVARTA
jgi:hypothetical protein